MNIHEPSPEFLTSQKLNIGAFPFYTTSVLLLHGEAATILVESSTWIKTLKYTRLPVNCIGVRLKCPWIILSACSNHVYCAVLRYIGVGRAQDSIACSNSIMCTKQFVICTPPLYHVHFLSRRISLEHCREAVSAGA